MSIKKACRIAGTVFLAFAASLVAYGLYGLSRFAAYTGEYFDNRLMGFDNGVYPFLWGCLLLLLGQCLRLHRRRLFMGSSALAGLLFLSWKRLTIPALADATQELFPDAEILGDLLVVCVAMLALVLADRWVQRLIDIVLVDPVDFLRRKFGRH